MLPLPDRRPRVESTGVAPSCPGWADRRVEGICGSWGRAGSGSPPQQPAVGWGSGVQVPLPGLKKAGTRRNHSPLPRLQKSHALTAWVRCPEFHCMDQVHMQLRFLGFSPLSIALWVYFFSTCVTKETSYLTSMYPTPSSETNTGWLYRHFYSNQRNKDSFIHNIQKVLGVSWLSLKAQGLMVLDSALWVLVLSFESSSL